jgi:thiol-disulfide isomerase/thioredoxin
MNTAVRPPRRTLLTSLAAILAFGGRVQAQAILQPWPGSPVAPPLELRTLDGQPFKLADLRGRVVLINFWATWCEPCIEEMPSLQRLRSQLDTARFEVIAVNFQEGEPRIRAFLEKVPIGFPIVRDTDGAVASAWKARIFPTSFVVDSEQRIRYTLIGSLDWSAPEIEHRIRALLPR